MAQVTLGFSRATHTPTPAYLHPHSGVRVLTDMGCGLSEIHSGVNIFPKMDNFDGLDVLVE